MSEKIIEIRFGNIYIKLPNTLDGIKRTKILLTILADDLKKQTLKEK